jgi:hypothetical protein
MTTTLKARACIVAAIIAVCACSLYAVYIAESSNHPTSSARRILVQALQVVAPWCFRESTRYSSGYSEKDFLSITKGMSETAVRARLGDPLSIGRQANQTVWYYSEQRDQRSNYMVRNIIFDSSGRVTALQSEFYFD